ncbi:hypothetical protein LI99_30660 [Mycolicibacterium smegmatis]|uniref:Uncharacterized protein n=1 Tax=Mycolicibacterium smegmatis (strain ATCC 700084 / mc(2)155) TaxID=246196 RepID=A0R5I2_MYCS2|nr:hypothetical protein MSMEG_6200 [Mycolicibacterium smegmatis MC2 155]AIU17818.1 hypothetical protein LI99_30660 [Mycolicibacterium smegmatis]AIU11194.1 hypothetical protein LJ00_30655 [Mycolicibacterium smegmatis MC2 155]AIU24442.1 hypothetical protein LI98_30665 [Mycolicibacterium smegmatis]TBH32438.1 hypothetical protein EYS45_23565 [Mycolicibacterium smegmatis MC2 155]
MLGALRGQRPDGRIPLPRAKPHEGPPVGADCTAVPKKGVPNCCVNTL